MYGIKNTMMSKYNFIVNIVYTINDLFKCFDVKSAVIKSGVLCFI